MTRLSDPVSSKTRRRLRTLVCAAIATLGLKGGAASATLLIYDGFAYPTGGLIGNTNPSTGNNWLQAGTQTAPSAINVVSGSLTPPIAMQPAVGNSVAMTGNG